MFEAGIASSREIDAKMFDVNNMLKKKNCKIQKALVPPNYPWKQAYAFLDTGAGPKKINPDSMDPSWKVAINDVKPQELSSTTSTPLRVIVIVRLVTQIGQQVSDTGLPVVKNLVEHILLGTTFIDADIKSISPGKQIVYPINSSPVAVEGNDQEDSSVAQVDDIAEHSICCRVARIVMTPVVSQVPVLVRALAGGLQVVETHPHLMTRRLAMVARGLCDVTLNRSFTLLVAS